MTRKCSVGSDTCSLSLLRYWAVAAPAYLSVCLVVGVVCYIAVNLTMVTTFSDPRTVQGEY